MKPPTPGALRCTLQLIGHQEMADTLQQLRHCSLCAQRVRDLSRALSYPTFQKAMAEALSSEAISPYPIRARSYRARTPIPTEVSDASPQTRYEQDVAGFIAWRCPIHRPDR